MAKAPYGTVAGFDARAVAHMYEQLLKEMPTTFSRASAVQWFGAHYPRMPHNKVAALGAALQRSPGVHRLSGGRMRQDGGAPFFARHRGWRFSLGRADVADAYALLRCMQRGDKDMTDNLRALRERLAAAVAALEDKN